MRYVSAFAAAVFVMITSTSVLATTPSAPPACTATAENVTSVLLNNADDLVQLRARSFVWNSKVTCEVIESGVTSYAFEFSVCGLCFPQQRATLTIVEDRRPTYADGAVVYTKTLVEHTAGGGRP